MTLHDLPPTFDQRIAVLMAGNTLIHHFLDPQVALPEKAVSVGVCYTGKALAAIHETKEVFVFDYAKNPATNEVDLDLKEVLPYLPGMIADFPDQAASGVQSHDLVREVIITQEFYTESIEQRGVVGIQILHVMNAGTGGKLARLSGQDYLTEGLDKPLQFLTHQPEE
ncbi:hypothetical protein, partial [Siphonobacter sp.]|uniref:hypothetical protein n=1 Tax=Siphonobacter sp. TaxID=1869184 RepID=UPI003B3B5F59